MFCPWKSLRAWVLLFSTPRVCKSQREHEGPRHGWGLDLLSLQTISLPKWLANLAFLSPGKGDLIGCELPQREQVVKANADVKGLTYCVLQCLQLAGLHESLALYPEFAPRFSRGLRGELSYNLGAGGVSAEVRVLGMCVCGVLGFPEDELNRVGDVCAKEGPVDLCASASGLGSTLSAFILVCF